MSGANGPDIAAVYQLLTQVARTVTGHDRKLDDLSAEVAEPRGAVGGLGGVVAGLSEIVAGHDCKLDDLAAGLASLRDAVTHYHSSVLGHGMLISELDERVAASSVIQSSNPLTAEGPEASLSPTFSTGGLTRLKAAETVGFGQKVSTTRGGEVQAGLER